MYLLQRGIWLGTTKKQLAQSPLSPAKDLEWKMAAVSFTFLYPLWPDVAKSLCTALWGSVPGSLGGTASSLSSQMAKKYGIKTMTIWIRSAGHIETANRHLRESMRPKHMSGNPSLMYLPSFRQPGCQKTNLVLGYLSFFLRWRKWSGKPCLISPDFNIFE